MVEFSHDVKNLGNKIILIQVVGSLDAHTFEKMESTIFNLFGKGLYKLIINLKGVDYISSAGAGVFIGAIGKAQDHGGNIVFLRASPPVREVFELLGLTQIFPFVETLEEAKKILE